MSNFDAGTFFLCELKNVAEQGYMPVQRLVKVNRYWYRNKTIGYSRQYAAKGVNESIDLYIEVQGGADIRAGMYVILGNGDQMRVDYVSHITGDTNSLKYADVTLSKLEKFYDVYED